MVKVAKERKEKLVSALSLWRSFDTTGELNTELLDACVDEATGLNYFPLSYDGHQVKDGRVRIFAYFARPAGEKKCPAVLLLKEVGKPFDFELMNYFVQKGYAVLMPDYSGEISESSEVENATDEAEQTNVETTETAKVVAGAQTGKPAREHTVYPPSLDYANYARAQGLYYVEGIPSDATCWYEWTYVALYSLEYLKSREDIGNIGVVGIRMGGEVAWKVMISPDVACGVPINAAGWLSVKGVGKFAELSAINLTDERHRYIAAVDSQSYAPFVKCPVLMVCALSDQNFDADRAYDTYARIGSERGDSAIVYSADSGSCIAEDGLKDIDIFLDKHLKGREIFLPSALNISVTEEGNRLHLEVCGDEEAIVEEMGICYAEADPCMRSIYRDWQCVYKQTSAFIKDGKIECDIVPFEQAPAAFVYAYAKYLNGFVIASKIVGKHLNATAASEVGSRMLFSGEDVEPFSVARYEDHSIAGIFLDQEAAPKLVTGYGGIQGAHSIGGIKTHKISSPRFVAHEGALLKFDAYSPVDETLAICVEVAESNGVIERHFCYVPIKAGGKWKRIILSARDFKSEHYGRPLSSFAAGCALSFGADSQEGKCLVTNILWL